MKYIRNDSLDPRYNLALEEWVLENLRDDIYILLWRNDNSIIIGRNQNTAEEINQAYVDEHEINVVRRPTGGGAVYHDLGNLNFSIITDAANAVDINFELYTQPVLRALETMGVPVELKGRNDILIDGKKCSGLAQRISNHRLLHHGAMLFDTDLSTLSKALNVRRDKMESKGVKSTVSRVTNIKPYMTADVDVLGFRDLLKKEMFHEYDEVPEYVLSEEELAQIDRLKAEKYDTWEWNYGRSPKTNFQNDKRFEGAGVLDIRLRVAGGTIQEAVFFGDFFGAKDKAVLEKALEGAPFTPKGVTEALQPYKVEEYLGKLGLEQVLAVLFDTANEEETML
ncbi:MAG: lipoate--protein ligase [Peptoniphilaceae bacterium]|jgi:lipoate-protein ligase A